MNNFPKLVYKNKAHQEKLPEEPTPKQREYSEKVAHEKLEKIMNPRFRQFSVRYMNIGEYRDILEAGTGITGGEVILGVHRLRTTDEMSFSEFRLQAPDLISQTD